MSKRYLNYLWGLLLIGGGFVLLAQNLGFLPELSPPVWMLITGGLSVLFFITYFLSGLQSWGWLFPAFIFGGTALTIFLGTTGINNSLVAAPILLSVALPFLVVYLLNRQEHWWALIPAWVMLAITGLIFLGDSANSDLIGAFFMFAVALPFLVVFISDRQRWWALIPGLIMAGIGVVVLLSTRATGETIGAVVMFAVALPFFVIYFWTEGNWWALIPAGIMSSIGVALLLFLPVDGGVSPALFSGVMQLGWALTFGVLWLRRNRAPTRWAIYPAVILFLSAAATYIFGIDINTYWPILLVLLGFFLIFGGLRSRSHPEVTK